jgi:hypothetical protein
MRINESTLRNIIREELFFGLDAMLQWQTRLENVLETALMDLEDAGCPSDDQSYRKVSDALDELGRVKISRDEDPVGSHDQMLNIVSSVRSAVRSCRGVTSSDARKILNDISSELTEYSDWAYSSNSGLQLT